MQLVDGVVIDNASKGYKRVDWQQAKEEGFIVFEVEGLEKQIDGHLLAHMEVSFNDGTAKKLIYQDDLVVFKIKSEWFDENPLRHQELAFHARMIGHDKDNNGTIETLEIDDVVIGPIHFIPKSKGLTYDKTNS